MAFLVILMLSIGFSFNWIPSDVSFKAPLRNAHKFVGVCILFLVGMRVYFRSKNNPLPPAIPRWMQVSSYVSHAMLYLLMICMPLSGWIMSTASGRMPGWFPLFIPGIPASKIISNQFYNIHSWLALGFVALICLHIIATIFHALRKEPVFSRMCLTQS